MNKYCKNCGSELKKGAVYCEQCGKKIEDNTTVSPNVKDLEERNVALAIVLSLVTCGIYSIYWFIKLTDDSNRICEDDFTSGGIAFLLTIITCGIYGLYWYYKMGDRLRIAGAKYGKIIDNNSFLYLILGFFGFGLVSMALMQSDINKFTK